MIVYDQNSEECMLEPRAKCPTFAALKPKENIRGITWWQCNSNENGRVEKQEIADCFQRLEKLYPYFLRYTYIKRRQSSAFKEQVESVQLDNEKVVIPAPQTTFWEYLGQKKFWMPWRMTQKQISRKASLVKYNFRKK